MKTSNKILLAGIVLFLVTSIGMTAYAVNKAKDGLIKGNEKVIEKTIHVTDFRTVDIHAVEAVFIKSEEEKVVLSIDENLSDHFLAEMIDGKLKIYMKNNHKIHNYEAKATVYYTNLERLEVTAGDISGKLEGDKLRVQCSAGTEADAEIAVHSLELDCSSGSDLDLNGSSTILDIQASSGSELNLKELASDTCRAKFSSGARGKIFANKKLEMESTSGARIKYYGNATDKDVDVSSGGSIKKGK